MLFNFLFGLVALPQPMAGYPQKSLHLRQLRDGSGECICPATVFLTSMTLESSIVTTSITVTTQSLTVTTALPSISVLTATTYVTLTSAGTVTLTALGVISTRTSTTISTSTVTAASTVTTCIISAAKRQAPDLDSSSKLPIAPDLTADPTITLVSSTMVNGISFTFPCMCTPVNAVLNSSTSISATDTSGETLSTSLALSLSPDPNQNSSSIQDDSSTTAISSIVDSSTFQSFNGDTTDASTTTFEFVGPSTLSTDQSTAIETPSIPLDTTVPVGSISITDSMSSANSNLESTGLTTTASLSSTEIGATSSTMAATSTVTTGMISTEADCSCSSSPTTSIILLGLTSTGIISVTVVSSMVDIQTVTPTSVSTVTVTHITTSIRGSTITVTPAPQTTTIRPVSTVITTVVPTLVSCPTPSASCNNTGVRFAVYNNTNAAGTKNTNSDSTYSSFNPTILKTRQPLYQNITYSLGGLDYVNPTLISIYNSTVKFNSDYLIINHVGYIFAQVTGVYTFSVSKSDDITLLWIGQYAYHGYTRANANAVNPYGAGTTTYQASFIAGNYYPVRIIFGQAQGAVIFSVTLTAPDGRIILNPNSKASPFLVQYSCDNTTAPQFPAFGSET